MRAVKSNAVYTLDGNDNTSLRPLSTGKALEYFPVKRGGNPSMKFRLSFTALVILLATHALTPTADAQTTINVGTGASGSASYNPFSASGGPFPFSNFGVSASANLGGTNISLDTGGRTSFVLPSFTNGEILNPGGVGGPVGYTPQWTGSLADSSTLAANATFSYNIGPFSGSNTLFNQNLTNSLGGNLASGGSLVAGSASGSATGNLFSFGYSQSALFASASATINVGLGYQSGLAWNPTATYGVNSWISTAPTSGPTGAVTSSSVSGGALNYNLPDAISGGAGEQLYLNLQPTVSFSAAIAPTSTVSTPISGNLNVQAFGDNVINYNFPIADPFALPINYDPWDVSTSWASSAVLSVPIEELVFGRGNSSCPTVASCAEFVVDDDPFMFNVPTIGNGSVNNLVGGSLTGGWNPIVNGNGLVPQICDATGTCYNSNDPNLPVGAASAAVISDTQIGTAATPEPASLVLLLAGLLACGLGKGFRARAVCA
jgi:hypothetical protein